LSNSCFGVAWLLDERPEEAVEELVVVVVVVRE
jgi:hypothetical protein